MVPISLTRLPTSSPRLVSRSTMKLDWPRCWKRITVMPPSTVNALVALLPRPLIVCALGAAGAAVVGGSVGCGSVVAGSVPSVVWATVVFGELVGFGLGALRHKTW
jgi:hypothetical protein